MTIRARGKPSDHHMRDWRQHWRGDRGIMERICPHGVGHPDPDDIAVEDTVHGCDGCCTPPADTSLIQPDAILGVTKQGKESK